MFSAEDESGSTHQAQQQCTLPQRLYLSPVCVLWHLVLGYLWLLQCLPLLVDDMKEYGECVENRSKVCVVTRFSGGEEGGGEWEMKE